MPTPDLGAISSLLTSLRVSTDLAKAALGLRDAQLVREKAFELTTEILSAQESAIDAKAAQSALLEQIDSLKRQITEFEDWSREKERYHLTEVAAGVFAYATKPGMEAGEPPHKICPACYQQRRKSILQQDRRPSSARHGVNHVLVCSVCSLALIERFEPYTYGI